VPWAVTTAPCSLLLAPLPRRPPSVSSTPPMPPRSFESFESLSWAPAGAAPVKATINAVRITITFMLISVHRRAGAMDGDAANGMPSGGERQEHHAEQHDHGPQRRLAYALGL